MVSEIDIGISIGVILNIMEFFSSQSIGQTEVGLELYLHDWSVVESL